ncbi:MAG: hypothetical protein MJE68_30035 [Proteobacteria bacterium]|nr:hypothetical protein [Pseudomonadota bacterium]
MFITSELLWNFLLLATSLYKSVGDAFFVNIKIKYLWILRSISPAYTCVPALEAPVYCLTWFRVVGASITVTGKGTILVVIVTGVTECDATLCTAEELACGKINQV